MNVFNPDTFNAQGIPVHIIGVGATGSRIALGLAKLGIQNISVWDPDTVAEHNIPNQAFRLRDIGDSKVGALYGLISEATGTLIVPKQEAVDGSQKLSGIVFVLTDTMSSRKQIWERSLRFNLQVKLMVETRMGADSLRVYAINPFRPAHVKAWEATLYDDSEAEVSACGASISVGATAETVSGLAQWAFISWWNIEQGKAGEPFPNEIIMGLNPPMVISRNF